MEPATLENRGQPESGLPIAAASLNRIQALPGSHSSGYRL